jgi:hypothetical protein
MGSLPANRGRVDIEEVFIIPFEDSIFCFLFMLKALSETLLSRVSLIPVVLDL